MVRNKKESQEEEGYAFCEQCQHYGSAFPKDYSAPCMAPRQIRVNFYTDETPITKEDVFLPICSSKNIHNKCQDFHPKETIELQIEEEPTDEQGIEDAFS